MMERRKSKLGGNISERSAPSVRLLPCKLTVTIEKRLFRGWQIKEVFKKKKCTLQDILCWILVRWTFFMEEVSKQPPKEKKRKQFIQGLEDLSESFTVNDPSLA